MAANSQRLPQAVVFDLDGTLADSLPDIAAALNSALAEAGMAQLAEQTVRTMVGNGSEILVERAIREVGRGRTHADAAADIHASFLAAYDRAPCVHTRLYPGARHVLDALAAQGVRLGVCTNKPQQITAGVLDKLGITPLFGSVVGGNATDPLKPAPVMLRRVLQELAAEPKLSVMVGDSGADAGAARAAGTALILLQHGYCQDDLADLGADAVLPGFAGLPDALVRVTRQPA
ncbi:MAG: HAD-IA family hydrolase [Hyphomicrobiaceae bacterium]|nr:HAD-IA family hydrolase [Hyphomicrobiaceae bacterium]